MINDPRPTRPTYKHSLQFINSREMFKILAFSKTQEVPSKNNADTAYTFLQSARNEK